MPNRVEEVRLRVDRVLLSGVDSVSIREESLVCWGKSREGVGEEEGEELVEVGVRS